jgi:hypothetical protein
MGCKFCTQENAYYLKENEEGVEFNKSIENPQDMAVGDAPRGGSLSIIQDSRRGSL